MLAYIRNFSYLCTRKGLLPRTDVIGNVTEKVGNVTENVIEKLSKGWGQIVTPLTYKTAGGPQKLNVSLMTIRRDIEKMSHVIHHVGPDKGGRWEIIND